MAVLDNFSEAGAKILGQEFKVINNVYIDLEYIQDLRFGAMLTHLKDAEELKYMYSRLDGYNDRYDENTTAYFPKLHITEEMLREDLKDPQKFPIIAQMSPMTSMFYNFNTILGMYVRSNRYTTDVVTMKIHINVDNQLYPQELLDTLKANIESRFSKKVEVLISRSKRYSQSLDFFISQNVMFLYDLEHFINHDQNFAMAFASKGLFTEHHIFAKPQINPKFAGLSAKDKEKGVDKMRDQLNLYCDFDYAPSEILLMNSNEEERR